MAKAFKYLGDNEREIPLARLVVKPGGTFEVDDPEIAKGLEEQTDLYEKVPLKEVPKTTSKVEEKA